MCVVGKGGREGGKTRSSKKQTVNIAEHFLTISIHLSAHPSISLLVHLSSHIPINLSVLFLSIHESICLPMYMSDHPSIHPPIYPSDHQYIHPSTIHLSDHPSICLIIQMQNQGRKREEGGKEKNKVVTQLLLAIKLLSTNSYFINKEVWRQVSIGCINVKAFIDHRCNLWDLNAQRNAKCFWEAYTLAQSGYQHRQQGPSAVSSCLHGLNEAEEMRRRGQTCGFAQLTCTPIISTLTWSTITAPRSLAAWRKGGREHSYISPGVVPVVLQWQQGHFM